MDNLNIQNSSHDESESNSIYVLDKNGVSELTREIFKNVNERIAERIVNVISDDPVDNQVLSVKALSEIINEINSKIDNITIPEVINGIGIAGIEQTTFNHVGGGENIFTITLTNGDVHEFKVFNGNDGTPGEAGKDGEPGKDGKAATITIGSVTEGDAPAVTNSGTEESAIFDFVIPAKETVKETIIEKTVKLSKVKQVYSSDETVVGIWLGNPLFRRVFTGTTADNLTLTEANNIDKIVNQNGIYGDECNVLPYKISDSDYCNLKKMNNNIVLTAAGNTIGQEFNVTAEYTKVVSGDKMVGYFNLDAVGYTGEENEELVIPKLFVGEDGNVYNVNKIDAGMFNDATNLVSVTIPETVKTIGNNAFQECTNLETVTIADGTETMGRYTFQKCSNLIEINLPSTIKVIDNYTFQYCESLETLVIPEGVTNINSWSFQYCKKLKEVTLPKTLVKIDSFAFQYCENLTTVNYRGTEEEWAKVIVGSKNDPIKNGTKVFNYTE